MKKIKIIEKANSVIRRMSFQIQKYSPEIFIVAGVIGTLSSAIIACKATTKLSGILEESKMNIDDVHLCLDNGSCINDNGLQTEYTLQDSRRDLTLVYFHAGVKIAKLYIPSIALGLFSLGSIVTSNNILRKRNVALAAAYVTVDKGFKEYRTRVVERFGETVDHELKYNIKAQKITEVQIDEETGKETKTKKTIGVVSSDMGSTYARFFDVGNPYWEEDSDYNHMFLRQQQQFWNDKLAVDKRVFLNDVYDALGLEKTKAGQVVGWVYNPENKNIDSYIDFGICDTQKESVRNFIDGYEPTVLLDFNVDGNVYETM